MSNNDNNQIPQVRPSQFENDINGIFSDSVNLFRGDVNLSLDLISLKGRHGLDVKVTATYGSNVKGDVYNSNVSAPTSILGLGWQLPFERIEVQSRDNASSGDNQYYLYTQNSAIELVVTQKPWRRATLPISATNTLNEGKIDNTIQASFIESGLALDLNANVNVLTANQHWQIIDATNQRIFTIKNNTNDLTVLAGGVAFEAFQYDFSQILYYAQFERWELVKDDGTTYFFGDRNNRNNTLQWQVKWDNWKGQSSLAKNSAGTKLQSRTPIAWNLAIVEDIWGDTITFSYDTVEQQVGEEGLAFTKACYLTTITDMFSRTVNFNYAEKKYVVDTPAGAREYLAPNWSTPYEQVPNNNPSPYQDRYETRYLDNIVVNNPQQIMLYKVQLSYDTDSNFSGYNKDEPLYGDTVKRTLTGIQRIFTNNCSAPGLELAYWGAGAVNSGALRSAITPNGANVEYQYKQQSLPQCDRQFEITNPWPNVAKPRIWFGSDYVVNLWLNESTDQIHVTLYTWLGRWQKWVPNEQIIDAAFDIDSINVVTTENFACLSYTTPQSVKSYVHIYHKDNRKWGAWLDTDPITLYSNKLQLAAGDNFFVTCDQDNRILWRYTWDCFNKAWVIDNVSDVLASGDPNGIPYLAATNKHYAILDYGAQSGGEHHNQLSLYYQTDGSDDPSRNYQWHNGASESMIFSMGGYNPENSFGFHTSASFIALTYITSEVSLSFDYNVTVIGWNNNFSNLTSHDFNYTLPKSNPSKVITIPFIAQFVDNSMIASGPNLLRYNGERWLANSDLDFRDTLNDTDINWFAYGHDYAIHTSNREYAVQSKLVAFDATTNNNSWDNPAIDLYSKDDPTTDRKRHYFPTAGADIATMGNRIYHRGSQTNWGEAVSYFEEGPYAIDSTTMINQGPRFLSCLNIDGSTAKNTSIWGLRNQSLAGKDILDQRYFTQINSDGSVKANTNGQYPSGLSTFITYLPMNKDFDDAKGITLNRYLDNTLQGELVDYCVESMQINNGYDTNTTCYVFDIGSATCDPTGSVFKYYKSTFFPGTNDPATPSFGYTENHYFNGLTNANGLNHNNTQLFTGDPIASGLLDGQQIEQKVFDADGNLLIHEQKQIEAFIAVNAGDVEYPLFGGYTRCTQSVNTSDGLEITTDFQYDCQFGKVSQESFTNITRDGQEEIITKAYGYGFQAYRWFLEKNVIDVPFSQLETVCCSEQGSQETQIAGSLQQYAAHPRNDQETLSVAPTVYAASNAYILKAQTAPATLTPSKMVQNDPGDTWQQINTVLSRTFYGMISSQQDVTGKVETTLWDRNQILPIASFTSNQQNSCDFVGFEPYEDYQATWQLSSSDQKLTDYIVTGDAYTGSSSFKLISNQTLMKVSPLLQSQTVVISGWFKASKGYLDDSGAVYLEACSNANSNQSITIEPDSEETWSYWQAVVNHDSNDTQSLAVSFTNTKSSTYLLFNNITITPLASEMDAKFYDVIYCDEIASIGNNSNTQRIAYGPMRETFAEVGPNLMTKQAMVSFNPRSWQYVSPRNYEYPQDNPTSNLVLMAAQGGIYETFTDGDQIWQQWQRDNRGAWQIRNGQLCHDGTGTNSICWTATSDSIPYAIGLTLSSPTPTKVALTLAIGENLSASWDPQNGWSLTLDETTYTNTQVNGQVPCNLLLVPLNGSVLLFADGRQVFAVTSHSTISGTFALTAEGVLQFANPVTLLAPQASMNYRDASDNEIQSQVLNDTQCLVKQSIYDTIGNQIADTRIAAFDNTLFGYRSQFVTGLDAANGIMSGEISDYYPDDEGYPYNGTRYEASPLGRPLQKGLPGKPFAITGSNSHITQLNYQVTDQTYIADISFQAGQFLVTSITDANGALVLSIKDRRGQILGKQTNEGDIRLDAVQQVFDSAGNIQKILHPNYFSGTSDASAFVTENRYNFLGQLTTRTSQDTGETQYIYDPAGRIRFSSNALTKKTGTVLYKKYDILGRITEEGQVTHDWGNGAQLQAIADSDPDYPHNGNRETVNRYDGNGDDITLRGRLWTTQKLNLFKGSESLTENRYTYDLNGNATSCTLIVSDQAEQTTQYQYNNLGNVIQIRYPITAPVSLVCYSYNAIGQNTAIGTADEPDKFARYRYNADGSLASEELNQQGRRPLLRTLSYNSPGWVTEINNQYADHSDILRQQFSYTTGGYDDAGYFNGNIASVANQNSIAPERSYDYHYRYDTRGQVSIAEHSSDPTYSIGVGNPVAFDANGNILTLQQGDNLQCYDYQVNTNRVTKVAIDGTTLQSFTYDAVGNVNQSSYRAIRSITYSALSNLPTQVTKEDGSILNFAYNGINQRVLKHHSTSGQTLYVHGFSDYPLLEIMRDEKSPDKAVQYIYGVGGLLLMIEDNTPHYILKDQQGSTRAVVDECGTIKTMLDYMPFGQLIGNCYGDLSVIRYRFTGQETDEELGLYNYRARFYDPTLSRFYSCDPKFQYGTPFAYCNNNPVNRTDPSGQIATFLTILIVGAVVGAGVGAGAAAYTGVKSGLNGRKLAGYIFSGAALGAAAGALSAAGGVGAFAAGSAAASVATTTAGGIAAGVAAGAAVGGAAGAAIGATQGVSQHFINDAFGVANTGSWQQSLLSGTITGAIGGAIAGGVAGAGGALATQQAARYMEITGNNGWAYSPRSLTQVSEAYSSFGQMGVVPLPSAVSRIPNVNLPIVGGLQSFVLSKFSMPTISSVVGAIAKQAITPLLPSSEISKGTSNDLTPTQSGLNLMTSYYGKIACNPSMSGSVGLETALVLDPSYWNTSSQ
ncbi:RHS repeat domain-containing protein [Photobacterium alginatilyticum]|uniref:RHS repeat-associated core domain-containing protein n=1 Tax=Photobacterium alginatilyticum TaxID=1775171 RepID=A0ABW9YEL3_9GAMM|nr:RHS repeat-associated core domain-containing protein [Photobacterium alginatilyticum]NBI51880.1 RHS repeat-associated core domain-containing protein [Photobacterium alginatilyticum]